MMIRYMLNGYSMIACGYDTATAAGSDDDGRRWTPIYSIFVIFYMPFLLYRKTILRRYIDIYYDNINNIYGTTATWLWFVCDIGYVIL